MGLGAVGIAPRGRGRWRVLTGEKTERIGSRGRRWFCGNPERAQLLADDARTRLAKLSAPIDIAVTIATVQASAASLGVLLTSEDSIRQHAERVVSEVEAQFERLKQSGELQSLNRSYREYRIATTAAGKKPIGYPTFISNYKADLVRSVAQHSRITVLENGK